MSTRARPSDNPMRQHKMASPAKNSQSGPTQKGPLTQELQAQVDRLLTEEDREFFRYALREYSTYRSVGKLVMSLNSCLDTPEKKNMLPLIRNLLPKHDWKKFDALAPYAQMAIPYTPPSSSLQSTASTNRNLKNTSVRQVTVQRAAGSFGFSIRGGTEHGLGIFVSSVDEGSSADRSGLQVGDELLSANDVSLHGLTHPSAVRILKSLDSVKLEVLSRGQVGGDPVNRRSFVWVDAKDNSVLEEEEEQADGVVKNGLESGSREPQLPPFADQKKKVVLHTSQGRSLGLSIRGGREYDLGVYVSSVERGSLADSCGLKVGDQILEVNGHDFQSILHAEAASILKTYPTLMITVRGLGKLPKLPSELGPAPQRRRSGPALPGDSQKNTEGTRRGVPHHIEGHSSSASRDRHASAPATSPPHHKKSAPAFFDSKKAVQRSKSPPRQSTSPPLRSKSPPPQSRPPPPRNKSPPPHSRSRPRRSTSPPSRSRSPPTQGRSPFRSKSPTRQDQRAKRGTGNNTVTFQNQTTVEVVEPPQGLRRTGNAQRLPLVRSHSVKTPNLPITVISEEPEEEEKGDAAAPALHQIKDIQRPHSFAGRSAKMRTPLPMRPSPLLVSETKHGVTAQSPVTSPVLRPSNLQMDSSARSNSLPLMVDSSPDGEDAMFSSGVGSQVMHASVSSPTKEMLFAEGRRYLEDDHLWVVKARLSEYERGTVSIEELTQFFLSILDTPKKLQLLREIRSVLRAGDLVTFDNMVSGRELHAIEERSRTMNLAEDGKVPPRGPQIPPQPYVAELKAGVNLRKTASLSQKKNRPTSPELGMFGHESAQRLVERAAAKVEDLPPRKRESYLAWKDVGGTEGSVEVEIKKTAHVLGIMIEGGKDTPQRRIRVHSIAEGSAADVDGFIQPGFELLEVDGKSLKARTQQDAIYLLTKCYASDRQTIKLTVLPHRKH